MVGNNTTTTRDLDNAGFDQIKNFQGTYPSDADISEILIKNGDSMIINNQPSHMGGEHWIALKRDHNKIYAYDSFGRKFKTLSPHFADEGPIINSHPTPEQLITESNCGPRSLAILALSDTIPIQKIFKYL